MKNFRNLIIFILLSISFNSKADTWDVPKVEEYYSENKKYRLVVTPSIIPEKYYTWNYYKNSQLTSKSFQKKKRKFFESLTIHDTIIIPCKGQLYHISELDTILVWERKLLNEICPVYAIVSDDGSSVVTFDNWYSAGYGVNVMVIYNEKGDATRSYKLEEITPYPLNDYSITISSIWWRSEVRFIDNERIEIDFCNEKELISKRIYNTNILSFENNAP